MLYKYELAEQYGMHRDTFSKLLNGRYFDLLEPLGYTKHCQLLTPIIVAKIKEIMGEP